MMALHAAIFETARPVLMLPDEVPAKIGSAALLIYMFFKVFDLAAALGGGLNMGNNLVAGARAISHDMARGIAGSDRGMGRARGGSNNQISQGRSAGRAGSNSQAGSSNRGSAMQQIARNRTFTGMAATAGVLGVAAGAGAVGRGVMAMANSGPNTNGSQFFIMHADYPLPPNYVIFARVTSGMSVVDAIAETPTTVGPSGENSSPVTVPVIQKVTVRP